MIRNFSPKEIDYLINLTNSTSLFTNKINNYSVCRLRYKMALELIDRDSMNSGQLVFYDRLLNKLK